LKSHQQEEIKIEQSNTKKDPQIEVKKPDSSETIPDSSSSGQTQPVTQNSLNAAQLTPNSIPIGHGIQKSNLNKINEPSKSNMIRRNVLFPEMLIGTDVNDQHTLDSMRRMRTWNQEVME